MWEQIRNPAAMANETFWRSYISPDLQARLDKAEEDIDFSIPGTSERSNAEFREGYIKRLIAKNEPLYKEYASLVSGIREEGWDEFQKAGGIVGINERWDEFINRNNVQNPDDIRVMPEELQQAIEERGSAMKEQMTAYTWDPTINKEGEKIVMPSKTAEVQMSSVESAEIPSNGPLTINADNLVLNGSNIEVYPQNVTIPAMGGGSGDGSGDGSKKKDDTPKEKTPEEIAKEQDAAVAEYEKLLTRQGELENMQQRAQNRYKQVGLTPSQQKAIEARYAYTQSELDEVQKKIDDFDYSTIDPAVKKQIDARNAAKRHVEQQEIAAERPANMFEQLTMSFKNYMRHWLSIGMMYQIMGKIKKAIGEVIQAATQLDKVMTNLRIVTNDNREGAMELMRSYSNLGQQLAATTTEVASAANDWFNESRDQSKINSLNC